MGNNFTGKCHFFKDVPSFKSSIIHAQLEAWSAFFMNSKSTDSTAEFKKAFLISVGSVVGSLILVGSIVGPAVTELTIFSLIDLEKLN